MRSRAEFAVVVAAIMVWVFISGWLIDHREPRTAAVLGLALGFALAEGLNAFRAHAKQ